MNTKELKHYEQLLMEKRKEILESKKKAALKEQNHYDRKGDFVDQSERNVNAMINIKIQETEYKLLKAIDNALVRIENKIFGICHECGKPMVRSV